MFELSRRCTAGDAEFDARRKGVGIRAQLAKSVSGLGFTVRMRGIGNPLAPGMPPHPLLTNVPNVSSLHIRRMFIKRGCGFTGLCPQACEQGVPATRAIVIQANLFIKVFCGPLYHLVLSFKGIY